MTTLQPRPPHHPHTHIHRTHPSSDFDSDTPQPPPIPPLTSPPPTTRRNENLNLSVLQRHVPFTTAIELIVPYAVVYIFSPERAGWEKCGIEGTLFVVRTATSMNAQLRRMGEEEVGGGEGYSVVVLNRRGLENLILPLRTSEEVEITDEYVIVRDSTLSAEDEDEDEGEKEAKIYGLWIFEEERGSTAGTRRMCGRVIIDRAGRVEDARREWENKSVDGGGDVRGASEGGNAGFEERVMEDVQQQQQLSGDSAHPHPVTANGPDLMALLNGSRGEQKENSTALPTSAQRTLDPGKVNLLDLLRDRGMVDEGRRESAFVLGL